MAIQRQSSRDQTNNGTNASISSPAPDDALRVLVRLLARQAARDWYAVSSLSADQTLHKEVKDDQA